MRVQANVNEGTLRRRVDGPGHRRRWLIVRGPTWDAIEDPNDDGARLDDTKTGPRTIWFGPEAARVAAALPRCRTAAGIGCSPRISPPNGSTRSGAASARTPGSRAAASTMSIIPAPRRASWTASHSPEPRHPATRPRPTAQSSWSRTIFSNARARSVPSPIAPAASSASASGSAARPQSPSRTRMSPMLTSPPHHARGGRHLPRPRNRLRDTALSAPDFADFGERVVAFQRPSVAAHHYKRRPAVARECLRDGEVMQVGVRPARGVRRCPDRAQRRRAVAALRLRHGHRAKRRCAGPAICDPLGNAERAGHSPQRRRRLPDSAAPLRR